MSFKNQKWQKVYEIMHISFSIIRPHGSVS